MNIPFIAVAFYVFLIRVPALAGTYILVSSYGREKSSSGLALLIYSIVSDSAYLVLSTTALVSV